MTYDPGSYEERQARNDRSKAHAFRDREPWTDDDLYRLLELWVYPGPGCRDESEVAKTLGRTIASCQVEASKVFGERVGSRPRPNPQVPRFSWDPADDQDYPPGLGYVHG